MKWILIVAFLTGNSGGGTQGIAMQEFDSKETCGAAGKRAVELAASLRGGDAKQVVFDCKEK